jgi:hypothetical protein
MEQRITPEEYKAFTKESKDRRMEWFRNARFGMFIHYGLFAAAETGEWAQLWDGYTIKEYEEMTKKFCLKALHTSQMPALCVQKTLCWVYGHS